MDNDTLRLECLKIAAQEVHDNTAEPKELIERAEKMFRFVIGEVKTTTGVGADLEPC